MDKICVITYHTKTGGAPDRDYCRSESDAVQQVMGVIAEQAPIYFDAKKFSNALNEFLHSDKDFELELGDYKLTIERFSKSKIGDNK